MLMLAPVAGAQSPFTYEAGLLGQMTRYEKITTLDNGFSIGANFGTYILKRLSIDLSSEMGPNTSARTGTDLNIVNNRADLIYNHPLAGKWRGMIGAGWTGTQFKNDKTNNEFDSGLNALIGLRYCVNDNWSWTGSLIGDFKDPSDQTPAFTRTTTWGLRIGVARLFGKNRAKGPCVTEAPLPPPPPAAVTPAPQQPAPQAAPQAAPQPAPPPPARQEAAPQPAPAPAPRPVMTFAPIYFNFDQATLTPTARGILDDIVRWMQANGNANVQVTGHTDSRGSDDYNSRLGARRATVAKDYLVSKGIAATRITTATRGESEPAETNDTAAGRAMNRRAVAIEVR